jgi:hypothetical protein
MTVDPSEQSVRRHIDQIYCHLGLGRRADGKHRRLEAVLACLRGGEARACVSESQARTIGGIKGPQRRYQQVANIPPHVVLDQSAFVERVHEEIARCLRTRRHLSVALLTAGAADVVAAQGWPSARTRCGPSRKTWPAISAAMISSPSPAPPR